MNLQEKESSTEAPIRDPMEDIPIGTGIGETKTGITQIERITGAAQDVVS